MGAIATNWIGAGDEEEAIAAAVRVVRHKVPPPHSSPGDIVLNRKTLPTGRIIIGQVRVLKVEFLFTRNLP